jgi:hypothetical protein
MCLEKMLWSIFLSQEACAKKAMATELRGEEIDGFLCEVL